MSELRPNRERHSIFWPLMLITVGVVLLLNTLGVLTGDAWSLLVKLWPLLFLIGGIDHILRGEGWVWGMLSIAFGAVFLLSNFGYFPGDAFNMLLRFWPLILIAIGLDIILRGKSLLVTGAAVVVILAIVAGIFWFALANTGGLAGKSIPIAQSLDGAERAIVRLSNPASGLDVRASAAADLLVEGEIHLARQQTLDTRYRVEDGLGSYSLGSSGAVFLPWSAGFQSPSWRLSLNDSLPVTLETSTGAGDQMLDLRGLDLTTLNATVAVGQLIVTLPQDDAFNGQLTNPIGSLTVNVPRGALVEIQVDTAITQRNIDREFQVTGDYLYSPGATQNNARIRLRLEQPMGILNVRLVP
ncbi:MAG: DUF5668 domain-containing protein [Bellilinea sp.]|jgi:hypothetical protein